MRNRSFSSQPSARRLRVEQLEDRRMLAVITVTNLADNLFPGDGISLREAILAANTDSSIDGSVAGDGNTDTIVFDASLSGQTINLGADIDITEALNIDATALSSGITIDAQQNGRIFDIDDSNVTNESFNVTLAGLTLTGGRTTSNNLGINETTHSGGAIRSVSSGTLTLNQTTVRDNATMGEYAGGGGVFSLGDVILTRSTIRGNETQGRSARGGGILSFGDVTLAKSSVSENRTQGIASHGGGITTLGDATLIESTLSGNRTTEQLADGGGVYARGAAMLTQSTLSGNQTRGAGADGGGVRAGGPVTVIQSTITRNATYAAISSGGGIWNSDDPVVITGSILSDNVAGASSTVLNIDPGTGTLEINYSLIGTGVTPTSGVGNQVSNNPRLADLADNGGLTKTHVPLPGSLAIDNGNPSFDVTATPNDQRGMPFLRGFGTQVDIGAIERQSLPVGSFVVTTATDEFDFVNDGVSLREAIALANGSAGVDTITFANALSGQTITLTRGELNLNEAATIDATALADPVTVDADRQSRVLNITADTGEFTLAGLILTNGQTVGANVDFVDFFNGGAVRTETTGTLTLDHTTVSNSDTQGTEVDGGGIFARGDVTLIDSHVLNNFTEGRNGDGGGIVSEGAVTLMAGSTVGRNFTLGRSGRGGGIFAVGRVTLDGSSVFNNRTEGTYGAGGGIRALGDVVLTSSVVTSNRTEGYYAPGGGISSSGNITITNSNVTNNRTQQNYSPGGGVAAPMGDVVISGGSIINRNRTEGRDSDGGAILANGDVTVTDSTVNRNETRGSDATGGGITAQNQVRLTRSTLSGNTTMGENSDGGGIYSGDAVFLVLSTVDSNATLGDSSPGGGIFVNEGVRVTQSTISGNRTTGTNSYGGGVFGLGAITLLQSTVTANTVQSTSSTGGGIWNDNNTVTVRGSILSDNSAGGAQADLEPGTGSRVVNFSLIGTGVSPTPVISGNNRVTNAPNLALLANNGGPTQTHRPQPGSLAIQGGDPNFATNGADGIPTTPDAFTSDQRGAPFVRISAGRIDIGAVESQPSPETGDFDLDGDVDGADFLRWQRGFGTPNASVTDGDADDDSDVDSDDLAIWESQFGQQPSNNPIVASVSSGQPSVGSWQQVAQSVPDSVLIDAAFALASPRQLGKADDQLLQEDLPFNQTYRRLPVSGNEPINPHTAHLELSLSADERNSGSDSDHGTWLNDELLEHVFG